MKEKTIVLEGNVVHGVQCYHVKDVDSTNIKHIFCPSVSPDLNLIENVLRLIDWIQHIVPYHKSLHSVLNWSCKTEKRRFYLLAP